MPITVNDILSIDYSVFVPSRLGPSYTTHVLETPLNLAQLEPDSPLQWMNEAMLGKQLGDRLFYRANGGIDSLW